VHSHSRRNSVLRYRSAKIDHYLPTSLRTESFEEAIKGILAIKGKMEIKTVYCLQTGDIAVGRSEWNITDGEEVKVSAKGIEVMKQQPDGNWKIVVDHAFGAETMG